MVRVWTPDSARARAVAAAQAGAPEAVGRLLDLMRDEDIPAWRATYLSLLPGLPDARVAIPAAEAALLAGDPMERAAATRFFAGSAEAARLLTPLLTDPVRLVRLDASWALSAALPPGSAIRHELDSYLALTLDQPAGRLRIGQDLANRGDLAGAEREIARAVDWDPYSAGIRESQGLVLAGLGRLTEAGNAFYRAAELAGRDRGAQLALRAGLAFAEGGRLKEAENGFRLALRLDQQAHRARYNLGLLLAQADHLSEAGAELARAEANAPAESDYPFALATVLLRQGDRAGARAAAERTLRIDPAHAGAQQVLQATR